MEVFDEASRGKRRGSTLDDLAEDELDLFGEAVTGQDIIECDSAVCASLPCHNNGVCNQVFLAL